MVETAAINKNPVLLTEAVRHSLGRALVRPLLDEKGELKVVTLDRAIEEECIRAVAAQNPTGAIAALQPSTARRVLEGLRALFGATSTKRAASFIVFIPRTFLFTSFA